MLKWFLLIPLLFISYGVVYLIYGRDGIQLLEKKGESIFLNCFLVAFILLMWILSLFFWISGAAKGDTPLCIAGTFLIPIILVVFSLISRKNTKKELEKEAEKIK